MNITKKMILEQDIDLLKYVLTTLPKDPEHQVSINKITKRINDLEEALKRLNKKYVVGNISK